MQAFSVLCDVFRRFEQRDMLAELEFCIGETLHSQFRNDFERHIGIEQDAQVTVIVHFPFDAQASAGERQDSGGFFDQIVCRFEKDGRLSAFAHAHAENVFLQKQVGRNDPCTVECGGIIAVFKTFLPAVVGVVAYEFTQSDGEERVGQKHMEIC